MTPLSALTPYLAVPRCAAAALMALAITLVGCETGTRLDGTGSLAPVETRNPVVPAAGGGAAPGTAAGGAAGATTGAAVPQSRVATVDLTTGTAGGAAGPGAAALQAAAAQRVVYFDFDSFAIRDDFRGMLDAHAKVLSSPASKRIVIEGHTDERGGREYNLALGQKRAEAVLRSLALLGAPENKLEAVSFGAERPAMQGADESAWARNRRAELKDR